jgi:hypothetical protein
MGNLVSTFTTKSGAVTVTITDAGADTTFRMLDLGEIKYEFDLTPDTLNIDRVVAIFSTVEFSLHLYDGNGNDLYDRLVNTTSNKVKIEIDFYNGTSGLFQFTHLPSDVTIDEVSQIVKLKCKPFQPTTTMGQFFANANYAADIMPFEKQAADLSRPLYNCVSSGRFIQRILSEISPALTNVQSADSNDARMSQYIFENFDDTTYVDNTNAFVIVNIHSADNFSNVTLTNGQSVVPENVPAMDVLRAMAVNEGSIVGVGIENFYRYRINSEAVSLSYSDTLELSFRQGFQAVQYIFQSVQRQILQPTVGAVKQLPNLVNSNVNVPLNPDAQKFVQFIFTPAYPFLSKGRVDTVGFINGDSVVGSGVMENTITNAGTQAYRKAFPASGNFIIEGVIRGCAKLKPFEAIEFDSTVPSRYQGKTFRPTYLSYNFLSDEIKFKAYEI